MYPCFKAISIRAKGTKMRHFEGCYKWDLSLLNLAPFLFVLITSKPIINIEASISANHNLLLLEKKRQIQKGQVSFIASLKMSHFLIFNEIAFTFLNFLNLAQNMSLPKVISQIEQQNTQLCLFCQFFTYIRFFEEMHLKGRSWQVKQMRM